MQELVEGVYRVKDERAKVMEIRNTERLTRWCKLHSATVQEKEDD